jgi:thioesterase domain-containing protein
MTTSRRRDVTGSSASQTPRMRQLANNAFAREVTRNVVDAILPLNDSGVRPPLYCVHSITGVATDFRFMAEMLGPSHNLYGIQTPSSKRNAEFTTSIEAISRYYVSRLVEFQPTGTLLLGGHSTGAMIALEMAHQLRAIGRDVGLLVIFDGELFNTGIQVSPYNPIYWGKLILNIPAWIRDFLLVEFTLASFFKTIRLKAIALAESINARLHGKRSSGHAVEGFIDLSRCTPDHAAFMKTLFEIQYNYCPKEYSGRVVLYVAKTQALTHVRQVETSWRTIAPQAEVVKCKGTHTSMLRSPKGQIVAQHLAAVLDEMDETPSWREIA